MDFTNPVPEWADDEYFNTLKPAYRVKSFPELIDTYPVAIPAARRAARARIKEINQNISSLTELRDIWMDSINAMPLLKQAGMRVWLDDYIERLRTGYEKDIKTYQYQLTYLANYGKQQPETKRDLITPERIAIARAYPILELLTFKRGTTLCINHTDHKPSLKYYPADNHVYCFACSWRGDAIDVQMKLTGMSFREAVRALAP